MSHYAYRAFDTSGTPVAGRVEADNRDAAFEQLRAKGLFPTEIEEAGSSRTRARPVSGGSLKILSGFLRQLSVLVRTSTPMVEALAAVERQVESQEFRKVLADIRRRVEEGAAFSDALEHHPKWFNAVARSLIRAGESSGRMGELLDRLSALVRQQVQVRAAITGALVYPCLLICVAIGVLMIMTWFVMPRFEGLFKSLNAPLPPTTRLLMDGGAFFRAHWMWIVGGLTGAAFGGRFFLRSGAGREQLDRVCVRMPPFAKMVRAFSTARLARVLGVLLDGKVPLIDSLRLTREAMSNSLYARILTRAEEAIIRGDPVSAAFITNDLITPAMAEAVRNGERTGQIGPVLLQVADFLDEDNSVVIKSLTSIIEPIILLALGITVGLVAFSLFMPLFDLTATAGGGGPQ